MLAPLDGATDNAFRELCFRHGADLTFTEMARLSGVTRKNKSTMRKIEILSEVPTQIQFAPDSEKALESFLVNFKPPKGFSGINFNLGCPSNNFIREGLGCAMIKRVSKVSRMVNIVKNIGLKCSIKMRLGMNGYEKKSKVYLNLINGVEADFFVIHARHGTENYMSEVDNKAYFECVKTGKNIIANGDIDSIKKVDILKEMGIKGVMIGREAIRNPAIFEQLKFSKKPDFGELRKEYIALSEKYFEPNNPDTKYRDNVLNWIGKEKIAFDKEPVGG